MADLDHRKRTAMGLTGFAVAFCPLLAVVFAFGTGAMAGVGWAGGEYASTFLVIALGAVTGGTVLVFAGGQSPWRTFGIGVLAGGGVGLAFALVVLAVVLYALSHLAP